jgi:hypothetical protein
MLVITKLKGNGKFITIESDWYHLHHIPINVLKIRQPEIISYCIIP